jgi:DNA-binding response OmpR family regulator
MKELKTDFIRSEINRLGSLVVETALFHPSGVKLHSAGQPLTLAHSRFLHESGIQKLYMLEFGEDERTARRSLGVEMVLPAKVVPGDKLAEDIRTPAGDLVLGAETVVDEPMLSKIRTASILAVRIRHRKLAILTKEAEGYLATNKESAAGIKESVTRIMRMVTSAPVRYLLIPRARVLIGMSDDLMRTLLRNALISEGHDVLERDSPGAAVDDAHTERPHILLIDLAEGMPVLGRIRGSEGLRNVTVLICADADKTSLIQNALYAGGNDWMPRPPSRDLLSDRIKGCQDILLRRVDMTPSLGGERRKQPRSEVKGECGLKDPASIETAARDERRDRRRERRRPADRLQRPEVAVPLGLYHARRPSAPRLLPVCRVEPHGHRAADRLPGPVRELHRTPRADRPPCAGPEQSRGHGPRLPRRPRAAAPDDDP